MTATALLLASAVMVVAAALQGSVGFGANLFAAPLLVLIDTRLVPGPLIAVAVVLNTLMIVRERTPVPGREVLLALGGRLPGSVLGAFVLVAIPAASLSLLLGALVLVAVLLSLVGRTLRPTPPAILGAGILSGFMATTVSIGGPPIALLYQRETGPRFRATVAQLLVYGAGISLVVLVVAGEYGRDQLIATLVFLPAVLTGFTLSTPLARHLDRGHTRTAVLVVSIVAGSVAVLKAVL